MTSHLYHSDVRIVPTHTLSSYRAADRLRVLYWTLWSPLMFERYGDYLLKERGETGMPKQPGDRAVRRWLRANPGQRELLALALHVCLLMFLGLAAINTLCAIPVVRVAPDEALYRSLLFAGSFGVLFAGSIFWGWAFAATDGNLGRLLAAALPRFLVLAVALLAFWWLSLAPLYFADGSFVSFVVFCFWGFGFGLLLNFFFTLSGTELRTWWYVAIWCVLPLGVACAFFLQLSGVAPAEYRTAFDGTHGRGWLAAFVWWVGYLFGLLRPVEWLIQEIWWQPSTGRRHRDRTWLAPGVTLLPLHRLSQVLDEWLTYDWQQGMRITSDLSQLACQQRPFSRVVKQHLAATAADDLPDKLAYVCDRDARCGPEIVRPPGVRRSTEAAAPPRHRDLRHNQLRLLLADALRHPAQAPAAQLDGAGNGLQAAHWYYGQGYLFEAGNLLAQQHGAPHAAPSVHEFFQLVLSFETLLDLRAASSVPLVALPLRPQPCARKQAWALVDGLAEASHWMWRARRCAARHRRACLRRFDQLVERIESDARKSSLAERKLIAGLIVVWRDMAPPLPNDLLAETTFAPVVLRRWEETYRALDSLCPWQRASRELYHSWQPGRTVLTFVDSLPLAGARRAVEYAVARNPIPSVLALCNVDRWAEEKIDFGGFCRFLGTEIAQELKAPLPIGDRELLGMELDEVYEFTEQICEAQPDRCVVLLIENAHLLRDVLRTKEDRKQAIAYLVRLERGIHNLALTVQSSDSDRVWQELTRSAAAFLPPNVVWVGVVGFKGVQKWLRMQFGPGGIAFTDQAVRRVLRLTGGHPVLLAGLATALKDIYNEQTEYEPVCPIFDEAMVNRAARSTRYVAAVRRTSRACVARLRHDGDGEQRLLLFLLARANVQLARPVTSAQIERQSRRYTRLAPEFIETTLQEWRRIQVVDAAPGATEMEYQLRSLSIAQWLHRQGPSIP